MPGTKNILVIRLSAMGDVAMTVPLLRALLAKYPQLKVTVLSRAFFKPFFDNIERVDFFAADVNGRHKGFFGLLRLFKELKALKIDAVADLHNVLRSKIVTKLFALTGKSTATTDKARDEKKALTRAEDKIFTQLTPIIQRHVQTFEKLGYPVDTSKPVFPDQKPLIADVLALTGEKSGEWIGIAPFAQHQGKVYPLDLMQQVIDKLSNITEYKLFLFGGGKEETAQLKQFASDKNNVVVTAGKLKLNQELNLISHLDLMLSMDSGNAHMAAMLGVKVITLWGATHPYAGFAPFNQPEDYTLTADREKYPLLPTSIYGNKIVQGYEDAMRTIMPEAVVNKIDEVLER